MKHKGKSKLIITVICIIGVLTLIEIGSKLFFNSYPDSSSIAHGKYDFSKFYQDKNNFRAYEDNKYISYAGIDVSAHQGNINWEKAKEAGVSFAMLRVGYSTLDNGNIKEDAKFAENLQKAKSAGVKIGAYFFSQAITEDEARKEARWLMKKVGRNLDLPVAYDMEEVEDNSRIANLTLEDRTKIALAFIEEVNRYGHQCFLYGNPVWLMEKLDLHKIGNKGQIWLAHYNSDTHFPYDFSMWQYSESGIVDGISVPVDLDILFVKKH